MTRRSAHRPGRDPAAYGDRHASVYDRIYGTRFAPEAAVDALAAAGQAGVLELGIGTGRLAIPLAARGTCVDGIEASPAMIRQLRSRPGGGAVGVLIADLAGFDLPRKDYGALVCAVSTLFMLPRADQRSCIQAAARHLHDGGTLFIEAFRFDPQRFDAHGRRTENRKTEAGTHVVHSRHDAAARAISITHVLGDEDGRTRDYQVTLHYSSLAELDAMAEAAGLAVAARWHDWTGTPARPDSRDPVSVYRRTGPSAGTGRSKGGDGAGHVGQREAEVGQLAGDGDGDGRGDGAREQAVAFEGPQGRGQHLLADPGEQDA